MATYLDRLSMLVNDDDENDDKLLNEYVERLNSLLFSNRQFVMLTMNYRHTGIFDANLARQSILHIWRNSNGVADMKNCCRVFVEALDDIVTVAPIVTPLINELIAKYQDQ